MFDKLEDLLVRLEEILSELNEPGSCTFSEADEGTERTAANCGCI